ncbi:uncharacterized protein LOC133424242 isoform X2 [Cololabis saira]|uniref:uncharacterized protein LOC133424242 isoform X2 n=1 Tax=Cololabis saira TaxID=129043 RepID=UPI002AD3DA59|nr:uncharacterized protein LOC133424242 isoform X2 [Cololabis saira]
MAARTHDNWTDPEVQTFLAIIGERDVQTELDATTRNERVFRLVSERMAAQGFRRTVQQCRIKCKKLKFDYRRIKEHNSRGEEDQRFWKWFDIMDDIYGHKLVAGDAVVMEPPDKPTCSWSKIEVHALLDYWANPAIQQELRRKVRNNVIYNCLSAKLATLGSDKTPQKCKEKIKKLKQDYRRIKSSQQSSVSRTAWFHIIDRVLGSEPEESKHPETAESLSAECSQSVIFDMDSDDLSATTNTAEAFTPPDLTLPTNDQSEQDFFMIKLGDCDGPSSSSTSAAAEDQKPVLLTSSPGGRRKCLRTCSWSKREVHALLAHWANPAIQQELRRNVRNEVVYNCLSAKLTTLGFNKTAQKCKEKIKKLKQDYRKIKNGQQPGVSRTAWFEIMDEVLGSPCAAASICSEMADLSSAEFSQSVMFDVGADDICPDETFWLPDEVQVLITLWAQPNIQKQLLTSETNSQVFTYLSNELALVGFNKTPQECCLKVNELKEEYKVIRHAQPHREDKSDWFAIMESVLHPDRKPPIELDSSYVSAAPKSPEHATQPLWTSDEVNILLTRWAEEEGSKGQLRSAQEDERVYARLSSELATQGFDRTTSQCRAKISLLKQQYRRINKQRDSKEQIRTWYLIMDKVLGHSRPDEQEDEVDESDAVSVQASQEVPAEDMKGCRLSISSLCLLVPSLRLMCAFAWQVVQCSNVLHYAKVEELVELVTALAPELLTPRERVQLLLRLRARVVLEMCRSESTADLLHVQPHLSVIQDLTITSGSDQRELEELENSKLNFVEVIYTLLESKEERRRFFEEVFPDHYGQQYEVTLKTLVWKFISRFDSLLPIPDIKQTAEWLSSAPSVMEECGQLVLQPEQLKALLRFHAEHSGYTDNCSSSAQSMFLPTLSLYPDANLNHLAPEQQNRQTSTRDEEGSFEFIKDEDQLDFDQMEEKMTLDDLGTGNEDEPGSENEDSSSIRRHQCSMCSYSDSQVSGLLDHIRTEHLSQEPKEEDGYLQEGNPQTCFPELGGTTDEFCTELFKDVVAPNSRRRSPRYQCDKCEKKYFSRASLIVHYRTHTGETPFLCSYCGQGFRTSSNLELHLRIHTGERRYTCHICGKTSNQSLMRHMRMHRGERNFLCTECGKSFLSVAELRLHMRYHMRGKRYKCKQCAKGFITKSSLTIHMRQHAGERPYSCSLCPKSFRTVQEQKKHLKIHSNKKIFPCSKCGKIFRKEDNFKLHLETHDLI